MFTECILSYLIHTIPLNHLLTLWYKKHEHFFLSSQCNSQFFFLGWSFSFKSFLIFILINDKSTIRIYYCFIFIPDPEPTGCYLTYIPVLVCTFSNNFSSVILLSMICVGCWVYNSPIYPKGSTIYTCQS